MEERERERSALRSRSFAISQEHQVLLSLNAFLVQYQKLKAPPLGLYDGNSGIFDPEKKFIFYFITAAAPCSLFRNFFRNMAARVTYSEMNSVSRETIEFIVLT